MKYFIGAQERKSFGHENYLEFQTPNAKEEFWDESSLYMSYDALEKSKFGTFLEHCMHKDILFDSGSISEEDWSKVLSEAEIFNQNTYEAICELRLCLENQYNNANLPIEIIWESDRVLARRQHEREAYPVSKEFYEEVKAIDSNLSFERQEEEYEKLLKKYNMPACFYPFPLYEPDKW